MQVALATLVSVDDHLIDLTISGSSASLSDYTLSDTSLTLVAGARSVQATVTAVSDGVDGEAAETLTVAASLNGTAVGAEVITILASPAVSIASVSSPVTEGTSAEFTVTLDAPAEAALEVLVDVTATATDVLGPGVPASVTIARGQTSATLNVPLGDDSVATSGSAVTAQIAAGPRYYPGTPVSATVDVADNDTPAFTVAATPADVVEGRKRDGDGDGHERGDVCDRPTDDAGPDGDGVDVGLRAFLADADACGGRQLGGGDGDGGGGRR